MQMEDYILEWIFLAHKQGKKLKAYMEMVSELLLKKEREEALISSCLLINKVHLSLMLSL